MTAINEYLNALTPVLGANIGKLSEIVRGIFSISAGGVTQLNIARYCAISERSVQRFMALNIDWVMVNFILLHRFFYDSEKTYALAIDEVVTKKAGKSTFGIGYFFSSIAQKVIRSVSFHVVSIVEIETGDSLVLVQKQTVKEKKINGSKVCSAKKRARNKQPKRKRGRPAGSRNKNKAIRYTPFTETIHALLSDYEHFTKILGFNPLKHMLADGAYGNNNCVLLAKHFGLHLVSKLNVRSALFLPNTEEYKGRGRPKKYGSRIDLKNLNIANRVKNEVNDGEQIELYHYPKVLAKKMAEAINVVIIVKTDLETAKEAFCILFSSDPELSADQIVEMYASRFAIEFNFRDSKQYFGLEAFKSVKETQVTNTVSLGFFMSNLSLLIRRSERAKGKEVSVLDIKAAFRADFYIKNILNTLGKPDELILNPEKFDSIYKIGAIQRKNKVA